MTEVPVGGKLWYTPWYISEVGTDRPCPTPGPQWCWHHVSDQYWRMYKQQLLCGPRMDPRILDILIQFISVNEGNLETGHMHTVAALCSTRFGPSIFPPSRCRLLGAIPRGQASLPLSGLVFGAVPVTCELPESCQSQSPKYVSQ